MSSLRLKLPPNNGKDGGKISKGKNSSYRSTGNGNSPVKLNARFELPMLDRCKQTLIFFIGSQLKFGLTSPPLQWRPHTPKKHPRPTYNTVPTTETIHELIFSALPDGRWSNEKSHSEHRNAGVPFLTMPETII